MSNTPDRPPQPVLPLEYAGPDTDPPGGRWQLAARISTAVSVFVCVLGSLGMFYSAETALGSGPTLFGLGIAMIVCALKTRFWRSGHARLLHVLLGVTHVLVCVLFFTLVNVLNWSPRSAQWPFEWMSCTYTAAVLIVVWIGRPSVIRG